MGKRIETVTAAAIMGVDIDVAPPIRARASSFASLVADLKVGDSPAARTMIVSTHATVHYVLENLPTMREKLRNSCTSSVAQARRRVPGAEYRIEVTDLMIPSGIYLIALIFRVA